MIYEGINVEYIGLRGADVEKRPDMFRNGVFDSIIFSYPGLFAVRPRAWLTRRLDDLVSKPAICLKLFMLKLNGKLDAILLYSRNSNSVIFWSKFSHLLGIPLILELCEWPLAISKTHGRDFKQAEKFCHHAVLNADAVIPISRYIESEVQRITSDKGINLPSFKIPILIDKAPNEETALIKSNPLEEPYLLYSGSITYFDIAILVIRVAAILKDNNIPIPVKFTGSGPRQLFNKLQQYARDLAVLDYIEFTGYVNEEELSLLMKHASALLAPLPDNPQSISRFPTKLGFYLSSGRPVITTNVGEVSYYLKDRINAYLCDSFNAQDIAHKVIHILNHPDEASMVGKSGQALSQNLFYYKNACKGIKAFIEELLSHNTANKDELR